MTTVKGYKGFNPNLECRGFQYEKNTTHEMSFNDEKNPIQCCFNGFHFCEIPFDVFSYYDPSINRFCEVEGDGKIDKVVGWPDDSKVAASKITIGKELTPLQMILAQQQYILNRITVSKQRNTTVQPFLKATSNRDCSSACAKGNYSIAQTLKPRSVAVSTGSGSIATTNSYYSVATNVGYSNSAAVTSEGSSVAVSIGIKSLALAKEFNSVAVCASEKSSAISCGVDSLAIAKGYFSTASAEQYDSIAIGLGSYNKVKGVIGSFLVLAEWDYGCRRIINVHATKVDGIKIKANTWYEIKNGEWIEYQGRGEND